MYLHLGGDVSLPLHELLCIIDLRTPSVSTANMAFTRAAGAEKRVHKGGEDDEFRSMIITSETVYFSPISSATLKRRIKSLSWLQ